MNDLEIYGKYVLLERLAAGGMGEVFLARAGAKGYERLFALKRILAQHAESPEFTQMLMNEARISVMLVHPNIAQVFEFGQIDHSFFMVLEFVEGLSLNAILRRGGNQKLYMRQADAVWVALQICRALHYAHNKVDNDGNNLKIVHRDISPHNILVDETGSVKLIDFGIAKAAQQGQIQTEASTIKGKIPYMSPEQASGESIDKRSDLYALGIVLYECLTFERMYPAGNTFETFALVRRGKIPDLDDKLGGIVPPSLLALLKRALQLKPDDRFQSAAEMETELSRILHELEPGHTSYALAELMLKLDTDRDERKARLREYAKVIPDEVVATRALHGGLVARERSQSNPRLLAPPLPVDVTLGSLVATPTGLSEVATVGSGPRVQVRVPPEHIIDEAAIESFAPVRSKTLVWVALAAVLAGAAGLLWGLTRSPTTSIVVDAGIVAVADPPRTAPPSAPPPVVSAPPLVSAPPVVSAPAVVSAPPPTSAKHVDKKTTHDKHVDKKDTKTEVKDPGTGTACVAVNAIPWAYVSEHGKRLGQTPLQCLELPLGKHTLLLENPALGQQKSVDVVVKAGEPAKVLERFN